ncbi:lactoylglutathione lyase [Clostridia bacterium]|nr:lactoylglutathione lyase [Clostridia bacterium]
MNFQMIHSNRNILDLNKSLTFYQEALGFVEKRRKEGPDGSFILVYLEGKGSPYQLELTWLKDRKEPYQLGDNEIHLAVRTDDYQAAHTLHEKLGCICYENPEMGIYFIHDPDGYWIEILPANS